MPDAQKFETPKIHLFVLQQEQRRRKKTKNDKRYKQFTVNSKSRSVFLMDYNIWAYQYWITSNGLLTSDLCGHWVQTRGLTK